MTTLCFIFGTRPEAIKLAPVILAAQRRAEFKVQICVTGQHREMLDQMLDLFSIRPDLDLQLMKPDQSLGELAGRSLAHITRTLSKLNPDFVLVQGDTTTVWAAAIAAFYQKIRIGHVEAGLRTADKLQPFPEEINRRIVSHVADYHFAPTDQARDNLLAEGIAAESIHVTGNTVIDALYYMIHKTETAPTQDLEETQKWHRRHIDSAPMVLITGHRRENFGQGFCDMCAAISELATRHSHVHWVYPVHLNPNVRRPVHELLGDRPNVHLIDPQPYDAFIWLMQQSRFILSDSGGVQEEAPSLNKRVVIMRNTTERPEGVQAGFVTLAGCDREAIIQKCDDLLLSPDPGYHGSNPYGDGQAAERILNILSRQE